jgi:hypothetical protein
MERKTWNGAGVNQQEIAVQSGNYTVSKYRGKIKRRKERWVKHSEQTLKINKSKCKQICR